MENIMLNTSKDAIKVVDFGLSNAYDPKSPLRTHCGSPEYAAPELFINGTRYGPEVDVWSIGVVIFAMVTGRLPFVTPKDPNVDMTERHRRLLEVINSGFTRRQMTLLGKHCASFQDIIKDTLQNDPQARPNIKTLLRHPWIDTHVNVCPRTVDESRKNDVYLELSNYVGRSPSYVQQSLESDSHPHYRAMYNILLRRQLLNETQESLHPQSAIMYKVPARAAMLPSTSAHACGAISKSGQSNKIRESKLQSEYSKKQNFRGSGDKKAKSAPSSNWRTQGEKLSHPIPSGGDENNKTAIVPDASKGKSFPRLLETERENFENIDGTNRQSEWERSTPELHNFVNSSSAPCVLI